MKKTGVFVLVLMLAVLSIGSYCYGAVRGKTLLVWQMVAFPEDYSQASVRQAMRVVKKDFRQNYEGCTLTRLWYGLSGKRIGDRYSVSMSLYDFLRKGFRYLMSCETILWPHRYSAEEMNFMNSPTTEEWNVSPFWLTAPISRILPLLLTSRSK